MPPEFLITEHAIDGERHVLAVRGEIDLFTAPELKQVLAESIEGPHVPVDALEVQGLARHLQPPQVGLQAGVGVEHVGRDVVEPGRQPDADIELVRSPVAGQGGVQAVGQQLGLMGARRIGDADARPSMPSAAVDT